MARMTEALCCAGCTLLVALVIVVWAVFFDEAKKAEAEDGGSASGSSGGDDWPDVTDDVALDLDSTLPLPDGSVATQVNCVTLSQSLAADAAADPEVAWCEDHWLPAAALCAQHAVAFANAGSSTMTERCIVAASAESHESTGLTTVMSKWSLEQAPRREPLDCDRDMLSPAMVYAGAVKRVAEAWLEVDNNWLWDSDAELMELHTSLAELYSSTPNTTTVFTCPVGCRRTSSTECLPCPSVYDACGDFGGCDPRDVSTVNATLDTMECVCMEGFSGRLCDIKTSFGFLSVYVLLVGIPCVLAVCFLVLAASREGSSKSSEDHHSIGMWIPRAKRVPGPVGGKGKDDVKEIFLRGLQYLQLSAAAFSGRVPWSLQYKFQNILDFWAIDAEVVLPEMNYMVSVCLSAGVALVGTGLLIAVDQRPNICGGMGVADAIKRVAGLLIVPGTRVWGNVYFGCTFYRNDRPSTFDADPQISCFESRWWLYAFIALVPCWCTFKSLHVEASRLSDSTISKPQHKSYPATTSFAYAFTISMVATTLVDVAFSKWHPLFSTMLVAVVHGVLALWILLLRPFQHTWMNRFCCYGQLHEVVSYVGAYVAVRVDDPGSTSSGRMFTRGELFLGILFVLAEIAWFFIEKGTASHWHPTLVPVPERQSGGSLFRLGMALLGIHDDQGEEEDEEHGKERNSSKPKSDEKKAEAAKLKSKPNKKRKKKTQSDTDDPQVAKLQDKVDELEEEIERLERELKGSAALERIYKTTIEEKDAEIKAKTRRVEALEAENLALKEKLIKAGGKP